MKDKSGNKKLEQRRAPVYIPFKTFLTAVDTLQQGIPSTLDRSVWPSFSGVIQSQILGAFKFLKLIRDDGEVEPDLERLVSAKGDVRKAVLRELVEKQYAGVIQLAEQNASFQQLVDFFRQYGIQAGTLERAIRFFLDACEYTGLKGSPLWAKAKKTMRRAAKKDERFTKVKASGELSLEAGKPSVRTIQLQSGGILSLSLSVDLMSLSPQDRKWLFELIDRFNAYGQSKDE